MDAITLQKAFQGNIFESLGLADLPEEEKMAILEKLSDLIGMRAVGRVQDRLLPTEAGKFESMLNEDPAEAVEWLKEKGIDFPVILAEEIAAVKDDLWNRVKDEA